MATADHLDDCPSLVPSRPVWEVTDDLAELRLVGWTPMPPRCDGCVTAADRELWARVADELDGHLGFALDDAGTGLF